MQSSYADNTESMNDVMKEMFISDGMPAELAEMMIGEIPSEQERHFMK